MPDQPSPRRRFQFRLRTLFVVVAIVAVQCAVCLPMLKQWQEWHDTGGTGSIGPFTINIPEVFGRLVRRPTQRAGGSPTRTVRLRRNRASQ